MAAALYVEEILAPYVESSGHEMRGAAIAAQTQMLSTEDLSTLPGMIITVQYHMM